MAKRMAKWWIPATSFLVALMMATFAAPSLGFSSRSIMSSTGSRYTCKNCEGKVTKTGDGDPPSPDCKSDAPVHFSSGANLITQKDLGTSGLSGWGIARAYLQDPTISDGSLGPCWRLLDFYRLVRSGTQIQIISGNIPVCSFDDNGNGTYTAQFNYVQSLTPDVANHLLVYTESDGRRWIFFDFSATWSAARQGGMKEYDDQGGNITTTTYGTSGVTLDKLLEIQQTDTNPALLNRFTFAYNLSGSSIGLLASITHAQTVSGVTTTVRVANYTYYTSTTTNGPAGTLRKVVITDGTSALDTSYYRYDLMDASGWVPLRYIVQPQGYDRLIAALTVTLGHAPSDTEVDATLDGTVATYADYFFQYDTSGRVISEVVQGQGCGCGSSGSRGLFSFFYQNANHGIADGPNVWRNKCTMTLPDGNQRIVYGNAVGQTMLDVYKEVSTGNQWRNYYVYNSDSSLASVTLPSGVINHDELTAGLVSSAMLPDATGYWRTVEYYATTNISAGAVAKYVSAVKIKQGELGALQPQTALQYTSRTGATSTIFPLLNRTVYRNTDGTGAQTTTFAYTWQGTTTLPLQVTKTNPAVLTTQNGSGSNTSVLTQFDTFGRAIWSMDEDLFIQATEYDTLSGGVTKRISDVNTASVSNEPAGWVTPAGGGLHLVTTMVVDKLARTTTLTDPAGQITYMVYRDPQHEVRTYPGWISGTHKPTGPTQLSREDRAGSYRERLTMSATPALTGGLPKGTEAVSGLQSLTREYLDTGGRVVNTDSYFNFTGLTYSTAINIGTLGTNYYRAFVGYDIKGRKDRTQDWTGTITRSVYDVRDRLVSMWIGTDDTPTSGDWSPGNTAGTNLIKIMANQYDGGSVGDGDLTLAQMFTSAVNSLNTVSQYDFRGRVINRRNPDLTVVVPTYDNLRHVVMQDTYYDSDNNGVLVASELRAKSEAKFDERGQVYQTIKHNVFSTGAIGNHLTKNLWYNGRWAQIKTKDPNGLFRKTQFDGVGRTVATFVSYDDSESTYLLAFDVASDAVIDETVYAYDAAGNRIQETNYQRSSSASVPAGDLATGWSVANARRTFMATWYDLANRPISVADFGNNGDVSFTRPTTAPAPNTSDTVLVTKLEYDAGGRQYRTTDNLAKITQKTFDGLARVTRVVENYVNGVAAETELDTDRITDFIFDSSGRLSQRIAYNPKGTGLGVDSQITQYVYGTIANQASPAVYRNDLLAAEIYPDSDDTYTPANPAGNQLGNGGDSTYDRVEYTYDYASRRLTMQDQRQTVHTYTYIDQQNFPGAGKLSYDAVTTLGSGVDGSVRLIYYGYDSLSRLQQTNSYADTGFATLVNYEVVGYDGWGNANILQEMHTATSPAVYTFENYLDGAIGTEAQYVRLAGTTYPNGREVDPLYPTSGVGYKLNRPDSLATDQAGTLKFAQYTYLGQNQIVKVTHPAVTSGLALDYGVDTGSPAGIDQFGRVIDHKWGSTADPLALERFQYSYNRMSTRLTSDRTYTGAPTNRDEQYTYDRLQRLTNMKRGTLGSGTISNANSTLQIDWNALDAQGNWRTWRADWNGGSPAWNTQARAINKANEIDVDQNDANSAGASITQTTGAGMDWVDPQYDKVGNLKNGPKVGDEVTPGSRQHYTYDAWNRLVKVQQDNGSGAPGATLAEYQYDGRNRRIVKLKPNGSNWDRRDYYYNSHWQVVEERELLNTALKTTQATTPKYQWVWDLRYIDAPVLRDENKNGDSVCDGTGDERLYYLQDGNTNVTALVSVAGAVVERYAYNPYGQASFFTAAWGSLASSAYNNEVLFAGYRLDPETSLYHVRNRAYHSSLGRWLQRDPKSYHDGMNLYNYVGNKPTVQVDPFGLEHYMPKKVAGKDLWMPEVGETYGHWNLVSNWWVHAAATASDSWFNLWGQTFGAAFYGVWIRRGTATVDMDVSITCDDDSTIHHSTTGPDKDHQSPVDAAGALSYDEKGSELTIVASFGAAFKAEGGPKIDFHAGKDGPGISIDWPATDWQINWQMGTFRWKCVCASNNYSPPGSK